MTETGTTGGPYEALVADVAGWLNEIVDDVTPHPGRLSIWLRFVRYEDYKGSQVEMTEGSTTRIILEVQTAEDLLRILAENIVLKVFGEELRLTDGIPRIVLKFFDDKYYLTPRGPHADHDSELRLKVTVYRHRPGLFDRLFDLSTD